VIVSVLSSIARRRLLKTKNPSVCVCVCVCVCSTVNWKVCKTEIALYGLYLSVIKSECVTNC
jgi:hypothetical protein